MKKKPIKRINFRPKQSKIDQSESNGPKWTNADQMDRIDQMDRSNRIRLNGPKWTRLN